MILAKKALLLLVVGALLVFAFHYPVTAQTFTTLYSFSNRSTNALGVYTNGDGASPGKLVLSGNTLYGTTWSGGNSGIGTLFKVSTDGSGFTNLHTFTGDYFYSGLTNYEGGFAFVTNYEGGLPSGLLLSGNTLYGTCREGGEWGNGTVFKLSVDGTGFPVLHTFSSAGLAGELLTNADGARPGAGLILSGSTLYGTTYYGGASASGTVFSMNTDGSGFTRLFSFQPYYTGGGPMSELLLVNDTLYGANSGGGNSPPPQPATEFGNIFSITTNGGGYTIVAQFSAPYYPTQLYPNGAQPSSALILSGNTFFGTCWQGGNFTDGNGTVFAVVTNGIGLRTLHSFPPLSNVFYGTNYDGANPWGNLVLSANTLYGAAIDGGALGFGLVFRVNTDGTGFAPVHVFSDGKDGIGPSGALILSGTTLYGAAGGGGAYGSAGVGLPYGSVGGGTVFSISLPPSLTIQGGNRGVVLAWPTNFDGLVLQSTTNLSSPFWTTNLPAPVVVNGQYTVTNPISGSQRFFRLSQ